MRILLGQVCRMLRKWALICKITEVRQGSMYAEQSQDAWRDGEGTR